FSVVMLTGDVTRLQHELVASTTAAKDAKLLAKMLDEQCGLLKYERDGLKSKVNTFNDEKKKMENEISYLKETTTILMNKVECHKNTSSTNQKMVQEERKKKEQELNDRITTLEALLSSVEEDKEGLISCAEKEKEGLLEVIKATDEISENLKEDNNKLAEELRDSLIARQKLNDKIDELEDSMKMLRSRHMKEGMKSAEELIVLRREKDNMENELRKRGDERAIVRHPFSPSFPSSLPTSSFHPSRFCPTSSPPFPNSFTNGPSARFPSSCNHSDICPSSHVT
ncbi:hypothetical protein PENTCL1PPCAC_7315, partial [Pristionchus entomophagus]